LSLSKPVRTLEFSEEEATLLKEYDFITNKSVIYVANVKEDEAATGNDLSKIVKAFAEENEDEFTLISARIEEELSSLEPEDKKEFLAELNLTESGLDKLAQAAFKLLGLQTYLTTGEKETRAWTIKKGMSAPQGAGVIHTDFEKGFIRANIVNFEDFVKLGGWKAAKENGTLRQEGKEYIMQDGDVVEFLFNV
jgi:ribosome-binding ATPase YchF (GTP1/OBG family)